MRRWGGGVCGGGGGVVGKRVLFNCRVSGGQPQFHSAAFSHASALWMEDVVFAELPSSAAAANYSLDAALDLLIVTWC